ncbi:phosphoenolpyruvate--protein phosphotransferase [Spirochaeta cellobiosiphila]|uniref:phosphoenolpyruvate--protein phosphotransferase n=1 Tax=Spirochaeta cellobiosiphila TaxID=504483 RepID=UPI00040648DD|nr:phosphoenolpyruvate--protein phosphotransferase [Spirochaeta cellobiosiphila]
MSQSYSQILESISKRIYLFESIHEVDDFLKDALSLLVKKAGAVLATIFVRDEEADQLVFRVGFDESGWWDNQRCNNTVPIRFSITGNDMADTFNNDRVRFVTYSPDDKAHPFGSKIFVPIKRGPNRLGVLIMAHKEINGFDKVNKEDLLEAASRLGDMLRDSMIFVNHKNSGFPKVKVERSSIKGLKTSDGVAFGHALPIWADINSLMEDLDSKGSVEEELNLFNKSLTTSLEQLEEIQSSRVSIDTEMISLIFTAQYYMLKDKSLVERIKNHILDGVSAPEAVKIVIDEYANRFARMSEERLAEKAQDVRDLGFRLISNMKSNSGEGFSYKGKIVLSRHIYPTDLFRLAVEKVGGLVLRGTGVTAHISILARSLNLPVLITDDKSLLSIEEGTALLLDATGSTLYINPDQNLREQYLYKSNSAVGEREYYTLKGQTKDGVRVQVLANVNLYSDARMANSQGAEGIGLYRSEFPFILKKDFLSEEQQYRIYLEIIKSQGTKPVIMRTTDIGGDKLLQGRTTSESNPFLGVRGIRFSLANREMFRDQLRAMLRAGAGKDLGIMLPMVTDVEEVLTVKEELKLCIHQLEERGALYNKHPKIGAMVELPSAAMSVEEIAKETDFLSIGSNDLTMYLLAVDRTNENLSHLYRSHHPIVLKVFADIAKGSGELLSELSVCGDVASDPLLIPFFIGLGIRKLSVTPAKVESVKQILSSYTIREAEELANKILSIKRVKEMEQFIKSYSKL